MKNVVLVTFERYGDYNGMAYSYFTDLKLNVNDFVIVKGGDTLKVVKVSQVNKIPKERKEMAQKWVIAKIDPELIKQAKQKEKDNE